jgi:hypothetical protein
VSILDSCFYQMIIYWVFIQKLGNPWVTVCSLNKNMGNLIFQIKFDQKICNVHHYKGKLLVTINYRYLFIFISKEVYLSVCISIKTYALLICMLWYIPIIWQFLILLNKFRSAVFVQIIRGKFIIHQNDI